MGNSITENLKTGTLGEIFTQLKLLENDIQSCFPLKDSGNDLISTKGPSIKLLQVKSTLSESIRIEKKLLKKIYDILVLVFFKNQDEVIDYNNSKIFIYTSEEILDIFRKKNTETTEFISKNCDLSFELSNRKFLFENQ